MANSRSLQPDRLAEQVRQFLADLPACDASRSLTVAFSGGLDSTVLLYLLAELAVPAGWALHAVHVHHGLNAEADAWVAHCSRICAWLKLPLRVERVHVEIAGRGLEDAAREARHAALQAAVPQGWIALAHHADDQAETLLHRLVRGTGVTGAAAMRPLDPARRLWRPLLDQPRSVLQAWAQSRGLNWVEDGSNTDESLTRNFLRHRVVSPLKERYPASIVNIARACRHFDEAAGLLEELAREDAAKVGQGAGARSRLCSLGSARTRNLLRFWLAGAGLPAPSTVRLDELLGGLQGNRAVRWMHGGIAVCAYHAALWFELVGSSTPGAQCWHGEAEISWGEGRIRFVQGVGPQALRVDPLRQHVELGLRQGGETLRLAANRPLRSLKQLCQEADVPPWWRDCQPLLRVDGKLAWVGRLGAAADMLARPGEAGWSLEWCPPVLSL